MFSLLDDVALLAKRTAAYITGKGATTTAVALASPFVQGANLPIVGLAVGLPITAAMSTMVHHHRETAIMNNFRSEIASYFHIDPEDVTHDHLRLMAFGDPAHNIQPQPFFQEVLLKNDRNRLIDIGGNIAAGLLTMAFVSVKGGAIVTALEGIAAASGVALLASSPAIAATIGLSLCVGAMVMAMDHVFTALGKDVFGEKHRTAYEKLETLARQQGRGMDISQEQVMGLIASTNPAIKQEIEDQYHTKFSMLPQETRKQIISHYNQTFHIAEVTDKINNGTMKINELAFVAIGTRSGVPEGKQRGNRWDFEEAGVEQGIKGQVNQLTSHIAGVINDRQLANQVLQGKMSGGLQVEMLSSGKQQPQEQPANNIAPYRRSEAMASADQRQTQEIKETAEPRQQTHAARFADRQSSHCNSAKTHAQRYEESKLQPYSKTLH